MDKKDTEFIKRLRETFKIEAAEHIQAISLRLLDLEKAPPEAQPELIEIIFREAHSLKGASRAVDMKDIELVCQHMENVFAALKNKKIGITPAVFNGCYEAVKMLEALLASMDSAPSNEEKARMARVNNELAAIVSATQVSATQVSETPMPEASQPEASQPEASQPEASQPEASQAPEAPAPEAFQPEVKKKTAGHADTIRISTAKLDSILLQTEEMIYAKIAMEQLITQMRNVRRRVALREKNLAKIVSETRQGPLDASNPDAKTAYLSGIVDNEHEYTKALEDKLLEIIRFSEHDHRLISGMVDNLLWDMKKVLMLPFSSLLEIFPRIVRDIAKDEGKEAELIIAGSEIEIDRRILEELKDPFIHLVRNCIDHGIEKPQTREKSGKKRCGKIRIDISQKDSNSVEIVISDDGAGINSETIKAAAVKLRLISKEEAANLSEEAAFALIYHSGFSTSEFITDISGRGLGLAILREKVEKLGGAVTLRTKRGEGSSFLIKLPLTLATFRGVVVRLDEHLFVLPTVSIERVVRVKKGDIKTVENRDTIEIDGHPASLVKMADVLEIKWKHLEERKDDDFLAVVLSQGGKKIAFLLDDVLGEQEILIKNIGKQLKHVRNTAGATILSSREIVPILSVADLMKSAVRAGASTARTVAEHLEAEEVKKQSVMVVEDSVTARTLLKNILESAGYAVTTAVDGMDAITQLKTGEFEIVVSDVDMPRMNGFDLTAKIRADKKLGEIPIILVTALETREHKERGIEVGANAYIIKSTFDQTNLLETIKRLI